MTELPQAFLSQMAAQLKGEMAAFLRTYDEPYQRGLRVNPWKRPTLLPDDCGERVPWEENGHYLALTSTAGADVLHEAGAWYLQEPSAMLPAAVLNAQPGEPGLVRRAGWKINAERLAYGRTGRAGVQ